MAKLPSSSGVHGRHEGPRSRRGVAVSWLLGISWLACCAIAFVIGFGLTGVSAKAPPHHPLARFQEPGFGAALVGTSAASLVLIIGAQISILRDRRRRPNARYYRRGWTLTPAQALRRNARMVALICLPMAAAGLLLRHIYG
jgi:hypothetical protein